ncbi:MAG: ATP-binding protein [Spirochaetaceae bacterium]|jgi:anti-sigma regulatory factor (Ser/Thr protein kinase)|nr:ATP-binding protein [Spirochaetaceae bacterium]
MEEISFVFKERIELSAKIDDLDKLQDWLSVILDNIQCTTKACSQLAVVTEEVFVNICEYAYAQNGDSNVTVFVGTKDSILVIRFEDSGIEFNPLTYKTPEVSASLNEREAGGFGILIMKKWMDSVDYKRIDGKNQLTLTKKVI